LNVFDTSASFSSEAICNDMNNSAKNQVIKQTAKAFLDQIKDSTLRRDSHKLFQMIEQISNEKAIMWGPNTIGFGSFYYKYESGREGDCMVIGFSAKKQNLTIYLSPDYPDLSDLTAKLGDFMLGKACIYIKKLSDIDENVLAQIIQRAVEYVRKNYKKHKV